MPFNSFSVRAALFSRLDSQVTPPIYSYVPQNSAYPYVRIGDISATTQDTKTTEMQEYSVTIHTFSKDKASSAEIEQLQASIYAAIHNYALAVSGYNVVLLRQESMQVFQQGEPNDRYWHGVQNYRIMVEDV